MIVTERHVLFAGLEPRSVHCGTLCELPGGDLLAAAYAFSYETSGDSTLVTARFSGGAWSAAETAVDLPGIAVGNPVLWSEEPGLIELFHVVLRGDSWTEAVICVTESSDGGESWTAARVVHEQRGLMTKTRPLRVGGRLLLPVYDERSWCSHVLVQERAGPAGRLEPWRLYGDTTSRGKTIQPAIVPLRDGRLLMLSRSPLGHVYRSFSYNSGFSWTASQPTELPNPNSGIELLRLAQGPLLLVYNPQPKGRERLALALSHDDGESWEDAGLLEDGTGEYSYPYALQGTSGLIDLLYTEQRTRIVHRRIDPDALLGSREPRARENG